MRDQIFARDSGQCFRGAARRSAIRGITIHCRTRDIAGKATWLFHLDAQAIHRTAAFAVKFVLRIGGAANDPGCQIARLFEVGDRRAEAEASSIAACPATEGRAKALKLGGDCGSIHSFHALVGKARCHLGDPCLRARIGLAAAGHQHRDCRYRHIARLHRDQADAV